MGNAREKSENLTQVDEKGRYAVLRTSKTEERRPLPDHIRKLVLRRDRYRCVLCGNSGLLEVDHILPWSAGGSDDMDNLRTLCRTHNQDRSNFQIPADSERRLPVADQCVYCAPHLVGEPDLTSTYCFVCNKNAPGIPEDPSRQRHPDLDAYREPARKLTDQEVIALTVAAVRAFAPPAPMTDDDEPKVDRDDMRDWTGTRIREHALTVQCRWCDARVGDPCVARNNPTHEIQAFPAHQCRIDDANRASAE